jgi:hypothetical protein
MGSDLDAGVADAGRVFFEGVSVNDFRDCYGHVLKAGVYAVGGDKDDLIRLDPRPNVVQALWFGTADAPRANGHRHASFDVLSSMDLAPVCQSGGRNHGELLGKEGGPTSRVKQGDVVKAADARAFLEARRYEGCFEV